MHIFQISFHMIIFSLKIIIHCFLYCLMVNAVLHSISLGLLTKLRLNHKPRDGKSSAWSLESQVQRTGLPQISWITLKDGFGSLWLKSPDVTWPVIAWLWEQRYNAWWVLQCGCYRALEVPRGRRQSKTHRDWTSRYCYCHSHCVKGRNYGKRKTAVGNEV